MPELAGWTDFHFLRPLWLLALLLLPLIMLVAQRITCQTSAWAQAIDSHLLKYLLQDKPTGHSRLPLYLLITVLGVGILAQAGPTWKKVSRPVHKSEDALVIVMDLSLSMQVADIKPSRLVRARHKLLDILSGRRDGLTALVVFAGDAHIVSPLTDDTDTIAAMIPALSPLIMPALGSRMDTGIELAQTLLKNAGIASGRILIISDGIEFRDVEPLTKIVNSSAHEFLMLTTGTEEGGPIPLSDRGFLKQGGQIVIVKTEQAPFIRLASNTGMGLKIIQPDDSDIHALLDAPILNLEKKTRALEREFDQWQEQGPWLLLLFTPLVALGFRRGWLLGFVMLLLIQPGQSWAFDWDDLWQKRDQQGEAAFNKGEHAKASQLFKDPLWRGSAQYRAGNYQAAVEDFTGIESAAGHYNRANALARVGQLDAAIKAYGQALALDEALEDARFNKKIVEQLKEKQQNRDNSQQENSEDQSSEDQQQDNQQQKQDPQQSADSAQDRSPQDPSQQESSQDNSQNSSPPDQQPSTQQESEQEAQDQQSESEPAQQEKQAAEEPQPEHNATDEQQAEEPAEQQQNQSANAQQRDADEVEQSEQDRATEQWLRRIPDDPGELLRRKFDYQYRQRRIEKQFLPPNEDETLW